MANEPKTSEAVVIVRGVSHRYGGHAALSDVSLTFAKGQSVAVVGPDGVGKSSLLSLIAGTRRLQSGEVRVFGADMGQARERDAVAARIAFMPQGLGRNLYPTLSVTENIDFHAQLYGQGQAERQARIARLLAATGLERFGARAAGALSGGMKQKLSLCCALIHDPDLLILDEPTTGVDPLSRRQFWALIDSLRAESPGLTVLVSTGYMEEAERFDRIVAINDGRILAQGTPSAVRGDAPSLEAAFAALATGVQSEPVVIPPLAPADGPPAIRAVGLTRRFGDFIAVDKVSFEIQRGEIFGFLGSNGCGKTTTMKMMVGLLAASSGTSEVLGQPTNAADLSTRLRLGYMSQAFSLYEELSVRGNLDLHAALYRLPPHEAAARVEASLRDFDLWDVRESYPNALPLGVRQRLQLAAACLHRPDLLILDEPTSGVDPAARDMFWRTIVDLARNHGVTVFISTHFMNEAERCDRISLMHAGKVLAVGEPEALRLAQGAASLEDAFVALLSAAEAASAPPPAPAAPITAPTPALAHRPRAWAGLGRILAFAHREGVELFRDRIRLAFSVLAPVLLLVVFGYGISFDVEHLPYAVLDRDQSAESRALVQAFEGSRYFEARPALGSEAELTSRMRAGGLALAIDIPPGYGRDLIGARRPEIGLFVDTAAPFRGETAAGYAAGVVQTYVRQLARQTLGFVPDLAPAGLEPRFRYNQDFRSVFAITPGLIMFLLAMIPAMMTALGVVREREIGSILNLYGSPASVAEFLIGKQLPYVATGFAALVSLILVAWLHFDVPVSGSLTALLLGGLAYVFSTTAFGILLSSVFRSQVAVMAAAAILTVIPALNFSGFIYPTSEIEGLGRVISAIFPGAWFQMISIGAFTKALPLSLLWAPILILAALGGGEIGLACLLLKKQEA